MCSLKTNLSTQPIIDVFLNFTFNPLLVIVLGRNMVTQIQRKISYDENICFNLQYYSICNIIIVDVVLFLVTYFSILKLILKHFFTEFVSKMENLNWNLSNEHVSIVS
jgi:hypothetical protein